MTTPVSIDFFLILSVSGGKEKFFAAAIVPALPHFLDAGANSQIPRNFNSVRSPQVIPCPAYELVQEIL